MAKTVNAYLVDAPNIIVSRTMNPICAVPQMSWGSKATDGGNLLLNEDEYKGLVSAEPGAKKYIKRFMMGDEFINNIKRYCLWLVDCPPSDLRSLPLVKARVEAVKKFRSESKKEATRKKAITPTLFDEIHQPNTNYVALPAVSSERRYYIPIGFLPPEVIAGNKIYFIPDASLYDFAIVTSAMHMAWMRYTCGRLKSDYNYSNTIVYNNFPWPEPNEKQRADIEAAAQAVLDARALFPDSSLADLYDPDTMPPALAKAHQKLDKLVEKAYGKSFDSDAERVAFLFERYQALTADLFTEAGKKKEKKQAR
jgi:hypothetical protein